MHRIKLLDNRSCYYDFTDIENDYIFTGLCSTLNIEPKNLIEQLNKMNEMTHHNNKSFERYNYNDVNEYIKALLGFDKYNSKFQEMRGDISNYNNEIKKRVTTLNKSITS